MAYNSPSNRAWYTRLDVVAAVGGLAVALLLFPLRFFASQVYIQTVPIVLGLACGLYLLAIRAGEQTATDQETAFPTLPSPVALALPSVAIVGMGLLVLIVAIQDTRSVLFFAMASAVASTIFAQIAFASERDFNRRLLLSQIIAFATVFSATAFYVTPGLIGIDAWTHVPMLSETIHEAGELGAISGNKHYTSPFYHLTVVASALVYDVSLVYALYLSIGLVIPLSALLVYATAAFFVPERWAILAAALYACGTYTLHWSMHVIPTSLGLVFFLGVVYALVRVMRTDYSLRDFGFLVLLTIAVILTHQVSTFIMLVMLGSAFLAQLVFTVGPLTPEAGSRAFQSQKPVNLVGLVVFDAGLTIFMWSLTPFREGSFLATVLTWFQETIAQSAGFLNIASSTGDDAAAAAEAGTTFLEELLPYVEVFGFLILLGITFVGCLYVVDRSRAEQSVLSLLFATAIMLVFILGLPMFGIDNFIPTRWFAFLYVPMALLGVVGLRYLAGRLGANVVVACLLCVVLLYPGAMLFAPQSSADNPVFPSQNERLAYEQDELAAVSSIGELSGHPEADGIRPDQILYTDHPYQTVFYRTGAYHSDTAVVPYDGAAEHPVTVHRSTDEGATFYRNEDGRGEPRDVEHDRLCRPTQAVVYTNGDVSMCVASPVTEIPDDQPEPGGDDGGTGGGGP
ncbi:DUF4396 domain-containing protein [Saliphagus infecundisoli]|uniref:DUF4396 domain-containing protein n=1 Tax=Saliphagus infecundisoli TaxID=1849069 RepID=A0ABD5QL29_9EURY|nr:DUF4396 domain-containing protein [Saliphagus infecundisoli]